MLDHWMAEQFDINLTWSYTGFDPNLKSPACLASLKSWDTMLATIVEGDQKAPFSIAITPRGGAIPFPGLLHFTLDLYLIMLSVKQRGMKYHF